jgi:hypothetical protein
MGKQEQGTMTGIVIRRLAGNTIAEEIGERRPD